MSPDIFMKGVVALYWASTQGMDMSHNYISSNKGQAAIRDYFATPQGRQTSLVLLPSMLDGLNLPEDMKEKIRIELLEKT
ncbi:MAG: hypothetical protein WC295_00080 [Methanoregula sp.]|jgi:hypothetical protein